MPLAPQAACPVEVVFMALYFSQRHRVGGDFCIRCPVVVAQPAVPPRPLRNMKKHSAANAAEAGTVNTHAAAMRSN